MLLGVSHGIFHLVLLEKLPAMEENISNLNYMELFWQQDHQSDTSSVGPSTEMEFEQSFIHSFKNR